MTKQEWLDKVKKNSDILCDFVGAYHPINTRPRSSNEGISADITAPEAERACEMVRNQIRKESVFVRPEVQFNVALQNEDTDTLSSLISQTWFGVPESTNCWSIPGFSIAVDLLDDPIEEI